MKKGIKRYLIKGLTTLYLASPLTFFNSCDKNPIKSDNPPVIQQYEPKDLNPNKNINDVIDFWVDAIDEDKEEVNYKFLKDNVGVSNTNEYSWTVDKKGVTIVKGIAYNDLADTVKWAISVENRAPVAIDTSFSMLEETVLSIPKNKLGYELDNDNLTFKILGKENVDASFNNENLIITGSLDYFGPALIKYEVSDGAASDTGNIEIEIENVTDLPKAVVNNVEGTIDNPSNLDGSNSYHRDAPLNEITSYKWMQLSGPDVNIENSDNKVANFTPLTAGDYKFILIVTDNLSQEDKDTLTAVIKSYLLNVSTIDVLNDENIDNLEVSFSGKSALTENGKAKIELPNNVIYSDTLSIRDEATNEVRDYFDYKEKIYVNNNLEKTVAIIPNLEMEGTYYGDILNLIKSMTRTRGTTDDGGNTTLKRWNEIPIALFFNRSTAPTGYIDALIQAVGDTENDTLEGWENKTGFLYNGQELEPLDLFYEISEDPETGLAMDYSDSLSHVVIDKSFTDGTPKHGIVHINNTLLYPSLRKRDHLHEFGHALRYGREIESKDDAHVMKYGIRRIAFEEGVAVRVMYKLPNKQNMSYYLED